MGHSMVADFFNLSLLQWLQSNLESVELQGSVSWCTLFGVMIDLLWQRHNDFIFNHHVGDPLEVFYAAVHLASYVEHSVEVLRTVRGTLDVRGSRICWSPPPMGNVKLNCDATVVSVSGAAVCGGVLRHRLGRVVFAYASPLDSCSVASAKLWAILKV